MLHEILLCLSGQPSPLLSADHSSPTSIFSPSEKALLSKISDLSNVHCELLTRTATIASTHPSSVCQTVATSIRQGHLVDFQRKVLEVEHDILKKNAGSVGGRNIVPLTSVVREFSPWTRKMDWFLEIARFMMRGDKGRKCSGAMIIAELSYAMRTGYSDIHQAALSISRSAEIAWVRQLSDLVVCGRLPSIGKEDFFVQAAEDDVEEYQIKPELQPAFVSSSTAASLLFIGRCLNHIRVKSTWGSTSSELEVMKLHLEELSHVRYPLNDANLTQVVSSIRLSLSQTTLQKLLPLQRVIEVLSLLRGFFLLGRGEFAISLVTEADEKIRSRWRRSDNLAYDRRDGLGDVVIKEGEVSAVLARTWAAMVSLQGENEDTDEDDQLELARDLVQLNIMKGSIPQKPTQSPSTPFENLLLSIPVALTLRIPAPLDIFLAPSDVQTYSRINTYLLSIHRAHIRLTDIWKITPLRRDHPAPPSPPYGSSTAGQKRVHTLRARAKERSEAMRRVWATSSAAVFFLGETEAYLQGEVVEGTWVGFKNWLTGVPCSRPRPTSNRHEDLLRSLLRTQTPMGHARDPQSLADAHRRYLAALSKSLLLNRSSFTDPLYHLLQQIDHLVALVHRIHTIWQSLDLEADEGVVDAFSDFHKEETDVKKQLIVIADRVKGAIEELVKSLRDVDQDKKGLTNGLEELNLWQQDAYVPTRVGRVDRLLMKLDFGSWFDVKEQASDEMLASDDDDEL